MNWNEWCESGKRRRDSRARLILLFMLLMMSSLAQAQTVPTQNLKLWLKADAGVTLNGAAVAKWADQSGNNVQVAQTTTSRQPAHVANAVSNQPAVRFDGVDDQLSFLLPVNGLTGMTVIIVAANNVDRDGTWAGVQYPALMWNESGSWGVVHVSPFQTNVQYRFGTGQAGNTPRYLRPASVGNNFSITTAIKNGGTESLYVNGALAMSASGRATTIRNTQDLAQIGRGSAGGFTGAIAEIFVYAKALTDAERLSLEQYLSQKYLQPTESGTTNKAPIVAAGVNQTITLPASATLAGKVSDDGLPTNTLQASWSKVSGPGTVVFSAPTAASTLAAFSAPGTYVLRLSATDTALTSSSDVTVTVNAAPTVQPPPTSGIPVNPGTDIQSLVNSNPEGTTFVIKPGVHRLQQIKPRNGNTFVGEPGAILSGAKLLTVFSREGSYWVTYGQTQQGPVHGECRTGYERCNRPEDLFIDDVPLRHATSLAAVKPGMWFFDYDGDRIYIADDPTGRKVETSVSLYAFKSAAANVTIRGLIVEKYAQPPQNGAIFVRDGGMGTAWVIEGNEVRLNHGVGIAGLGNRTIVRNNRVHTNGQMGIGGNGDDVLIEGNEIYNNLLPVIGVNDFWEGGGTKFALTNRLVVKNNYVHDNYGTGLWTDIDNINTLYEGNRVINNVGNGITHEISYNAIIRNNVVRNNGKGNPSWLWGSQILIQNSQRVEVHGNMVEVASDTGNGIGIICQNRGAGKYGPYVPIYNNIHHNTVIHRKSPQGANGGVADYDHETMYSGSNVLDYNTYYVTDLNASHWQWRGYQTWSGMRVQGHERNGTISTAQPPAQ